MRFTTFKEVKKTDGNHVPDIEVLQGLPCGLHRAPLDKACDLMPELAEIFKSFPHFDQADKYEVDVKIHMLMKGQYPCIPNWHCDNVPRDPNSNLIYNFPNDLQTDEMYLWLSGEPLTEFLSRDISTPFFPSTHADVARAIKQERWPTTKVPEKTWVSFDRNSPHRGGVCEKNTWRVFIRITNKNILPSRPVISEIRRHCQVYLPTNFNW